MGIQLILVISGAYLPRDIVEYITGNEMVIFSIFYDDSSCMIPKLCSMMDLLPNEKLKNWVDMPQDTETLDEIGLNSKSAFVNLLLIIVLLLIFSVIHLILTIIKKSKINAGDASRKRKLWVRFTNKLWRMFTFGMYLRVCLVAYLYASISCTSEIYKLDLDAAVNIVSYVIAWILLIV